MMAITTSSSTSVKPVEAVTADWLRLVRERCSYRYRFDSQTVR